ncbi:hypothetical protein B4U84_28535 [Westiellopsis prolifica IICB1]|nr:hypothetical protein B4U84_28535 [Westiellopsis prolifica IICB1]
MQMKDKSISPYLERLSQQDINIIKDWLSGLRGTGVEGEDLCSELGKRYCSFYGRPNEYTSWNMIGASLIYYFGRADK